MSKELVSKEKGFVLSCKCLKCGAMLDLCEQDFKSFISTDQAKKFYMIPAVICGDCLLLCSSKLKSVSEE